MDVVFDRGNREAPKGHALLYFRSNQNPDEIWATYLVILPITVDVSKYVPPFLMNQVGDIGPKDLSAFAFPPAPEIVDSYGFIENLAVARDDDILTAGTINPNDVASAMMAVNDAVQWYADIYTEIVSPEEPAELAADYAATGLGVNEVLYGLMSDTDKLSELTTLVGRLRYAGEGNGESMMREAEGDLTLLSKHMPDNHQVDRLIEMAKLNDKLGIQLTELYLKRCFHLVQEEYVKLGQVEQEIKELESGE